MYNLRLCLFYSYVVYAFFLPCILIFLFLIYKHFNSFLIPIIIIDTILILSLLIILYLFPNKQENQRLLLYIILIIITIFITLRNLYVFISIIYRTMTEFEKIKAIFLDAIDRQVRSLFFFSQHIIFIIFRLILFKNQKIQYGK